jgi:hypothetical protein
MANLTRRDLLKRSIWLPVLATAGASLAGCGDEKLTCNDTSGLASADLTMRQSQAYTDVTPDASKTCDGCSLFKAPAQTNACGSCTVLKGPVHPKGYCKLWAKKA